MVAIIGLNPASHDPFSLPVLIPCSYMTGLEDTPKASLLTVVMGFDVVGPLRSSGRYWDFNNNPILHMCTGTKARGQLNQAKCTVRATCICCR